MQWLSKLTPRIVLAKQKKKEKIWWESKMANGKIMIVHFRWKLLINWKASQVSTFPISHFSAVWKFLFYGRRLRVWYTALNFINWPKKFPLYLYLFVCFFFVFVNIVFEQLWHVCCAYYWRSRSQVSHCCCLSVSFIISSSTTITIIFVVIISATDDTLIYQVSGSVTA